jgi:rhamnose transport system permease protein
MPPRMLKTMKRLPRKPPLLSRDASLLLLTLLLVGAVSTRFPQFVTPTNLKSVIDDTSILILLALAQMPVLLTRSIDLSVAANLALTGMCTALFNQALPDVGMPTVIILAIAIGAALGAVNGLLIWLLEVPPIVATLGTLAIYRGLVFVVSGGAWITNNKMSTDFLNFVRFDILGITVLTWVAVAFSILAYLGLRYTETGRDFFIAGSNPEATVYAGIDVRRMRFMAFALSGAIAGLCGYFWVSRFAIAYTDIAQGFELQVIAACVIGGVSIAGGYGTVLGVIAGGLFLGTIKNALPLVAISPFWQMAISGLVIISAVILNARRTKGIPRRILESSST